MDVTATTLVLAVLAALGGGALGAAMGALPSFIFAGFLTIAGAAMQAVGYQLGLAGVTEQVAPTLYAAAFGPLFGPQVGFAGGVAAHAYAAKYHPEVQSQDGWGYHDAKNIAISLGAECPDVLLVGALFGAGGELLKLATDAATGPHPGWGLAHIAWIVVLSGFVARLLFGYSLFGDREGTSERTGTDLSGTSWFSFAADDAEPHLSHQFTFKSLLLGALVGLVTGYVALVTHNPWLGFGVSAASLIFLEFDAGGRGDAPLAGMPVTHHITLPAGVAAVAGLRVGGPAYAVAWALVFGVLGEFFHHVSDRAFYAWGETHLDPPAASITITIFVVVALSLLGVLGPNAFQAEVLHLY